MTPHENALILIETFGYNSRQVAEVLDISVQVAGRKMKSAGYEKFTKEQYDNLFTHFRKLTTEREYLLRKLTAER